MKLEIARDHFKYTSGKRYRREGEYSGEEFRDEILYPRWLMCEQMKSFMEINFDQLTGYTDEWLEEVFGGFIRKYGHPNYMRRITIKCTKEYGLINKFHHNDTYSITKSTGDFELVDKINRIVANARKEYFRQQRLSKQQ